MSAASKVDWLRNWRDETFRPGELRLVAWSTAWFFCLLGGYYQLRPLREAEAFASGSDEIPWLFLASFLTMLAAAPVYASVANRGRGMKLVSRVYRFFEINLLVFFVAMQWSESAMAAWVGRVFFVWLSVFNLFVVSLMWSVFADAFQSGQAKRLFGMISAGGTLGGIVGSAFAGWMVQYVDVAYVLIAGVATLEACQWCGHHFTRALRQTNAREFPPVDPLQSPNVVTTHSADKKSIWIGILSIARSPYLLGICFFLLAFQSCATTVYCQQADFIREAGLDMTARFALMSRINLWVLVLTLTVQLLGTSILLRRLGLAMVLALFPAIYLIGFAGLALWPSLGWLVGLVVVHRAASYAVIAPAIQVLYTVVDRRTLYQAKGFLDTAIVRGGDVMSAQLFGLLRSSGLALTVIAAGFVPVAAIACFLGMQSGRRQSLLQKEFHSSETATASSV